MSQHDFNIANQSFPATRTDLNNALVALASNSSGDAEPATKYANQWWYETDTNTLKLRNEANDAWISIAVLDQSGNAVQSITTAGLTLGSTAISATGTEINQLDAITRGSILYGNASGATARLPKGSAGTVLSSDGTDISWAAAAAGGALEFIASSSAISNAASVSFTQFDASKYDSYQFHLLYVIPATDATRLFAHASTNGGSSYDTTNGNYRFGSATNSTGFVMTQSETIGSGANEFGVCGHLSIFNPALSGTYTMAKAEIILIDSAGNVNDGAIDSAGCSVYQNTAAVNAMQFKMLSGNIESGEIVMYGIKNL